MVSETSMLRPRRRPTMGWLAGCAVACAMAPSAAGADPPPESTMTVNGTGAVMIAPDVGVLSLQVNRSAPTATGARFKTNRATNAFVAAIVRLGISAPGIQTTAISLNPSQVGRRGRRHRIYTASLSLDVSTSHVGLVGPVVDAATSAAVDVTDGPRFSFSSPSAGKAQATRAALADARTRADDAAAAVGYRVTALRSIAIDPQLGGPAGASGNSSSGALASPRRGKSRTPTPVSPGRQEVDATVTVVYVVAPAA